MSSFKRLLVLSSLFAAASCGSLTNGTSILPGQSQTPLAGLGKLTFAVGTARLQDGTTGLNVVAYLRQANGLTAYLVNSPSITGPSGFVVPSGAGNVDAGTNSITSTPQSGSTATTFGTQGGVFGGGIGPFNATQNSSNFYPGNPPPYTTPFYATGTGAGGPVSLLIGPPAVAQFTNIDFPPGFAGYLPGFTAFAAAPVAGAYTMKVSVAAANAAGTTLTGTASLNSTTPMGAVPAPTFAKDGAGGGTVSFTAPGGATESIVFILDLTATPNVYYAIGPIMGSGAQSGTLTDSLGPCGSPPCGSTSIPTGDTYSITVVSFDYPDFEATQPGNKSQTPTVLGTAGQADISISPATTGTY
jgi:hypothetical protein